MARVDIRLIALDMDGTLLDSKKRLSERNRQALLACVGRGIEIVPCTGRIWKGVPDFIREFPGIHYAITTNGAVVEDVKENRILDERKLSPQKAAEVLRLARSFRTMYDVYVGGLAFGETRFIEHMSDYGVEPELQKMILQTRQAVPDVIEEVLRRNQPVDKINYFFGDIQERSRARQALLERGDVVVSSSFRTNLEINAVGATKGEAILRLAEHIGIRPEQTMGFGDGENDVTMIRAAGIGVAMENAVEVLKRDADYITGKNDEDGVAAAIEALVLNQEA